MLHGQVLNQRPLSLTFLRESKVGYIIEISVLRHSKQTQWKMDQKYPKMILEYIGYAQNCCITFHYVSLAMIIWLPLWHIQPCQSRTMTRTSTALVVGRSCCPRLCHLVADFWSYSYHSLYIYSLSTWKYQESTTTKVTKWPFNFVQFLGREAFKLDLRTYSWTLPKGILPGFQLEANPPQAELPSYQLLEDTTGLVHHGCFLPGVYGYTPFFQVTVIIIPKSVVEWDMLLRCSHRHS